MYIHSPTITAATEDSKFLATPFSSINTEGINLRRQGVAIKMGASNFVLEDNDVLAIAGIPESP